MRLLPCLALLALAACQGTQPAGIVNLSDSAVTVEKMAATKPGGVEETAARSCGVYGKAPVLMGQNCIDAYCLRARYLYACK